MAPPSGNASRPGRHLAVLVGIIVVLLLAIVGGGIASPASWHKHFQVRLGLDLTSGTTVSLKAVPVHGHAVTAAEMTQAQQIMFNRVNSAGFTEAQVVPQGNNIMTVSVPGQNSQQVVKLVSQTAVLLFRQVLLIAPNASSAVTPATTPTPVPGTPALLLTRLPRPGSPVINAGSNPAIPASSVPGIPSSTIELPLG